MEPDRLNTPDTSAIKIELLGHELQFSQDPNSKHLGTTVWDASLVFAKYLEKNCRRGQFRRSKLKSKRAIELGAGCGVAGFGLALLGCDVVSTDQKEVTPLLSRNIHRNTSRTLQNSSDKDSFGSIKVAELDWGNEEHIKAVTPPFDYIVGTDIVYAEHLLQRLLKTVLALYGPKTTILLGHEIRSASLNEQMLSTWKDFFDVKIVARSKMDCKYQHPSIQIFTMRLKNAPRLLIKDVEGDPCCEGNDSNVNGGVSGGEGSDLVHRLESGDALDEWEARRIGSMAARLLRDVKLS